jgi:hypothetical protein
LLNNHFTASLLSLVFFLLIVQIWYSSFLSSLCYYQRDWRLHLLDRFIFLFRIWVFAFATTKIFTLEGSNISLQGFKCRSLRIKSAFCFILFLFLPERTILWYLQMADGHIVSPFFSIICLPLLTKFLWLLEIVTLLIMELAP